MAPTSKKKIAIIGHDSTHVTAFTQRLFEDADLSKEWQVQSIYRDHQSEMALSRNRQASIEKSLKDYPIAWYDDKRKLEEHDAYMILNVDASYHLDWIERLAVYQKPIFVDKPLVYDSKECDRILQLEKKGLKLFSSSALYFSPFVKRLADTINESTRKIVIEGPAYREKEVPAFHWYGIHLLTILHRLIGIDFHFKSCEKKANYDRIAFEAKGIECVLHAYPQDMHEFRAMVMNREGLFSDSIVNDQKPLYDYLLKAVLQFFKEGKTSISVQESCEMMKKLSQINHALNE